MVGEGGGEGEEEGGEEGDEEGVVGRSGDRSRRGFFGVWDLGIGLDGGRAACLSV